MIELLAVADPGVDAWQFFGRLHPLVLHFPIAMILAAAAVELVLVIRRDARPSGIAAFCMWVGTIGAAIAAWSGWIFSEEHGSGNTLELHRWFGIAAAGVLIGVSICWLIERSNRTNWSFHGYRFGLWIGALLIITTGYFGGEMVWGEGYLFEHDESSEVSPAAASTPVDTGTALQAQAVSILESRCQECHGPRKQKGDLQLVPMAKAFPAGKEKDWVIKPGDPDQSELIRRVSLPVDDDDHMPPKGDPLDAGQVDLLSNWIKEGAPHDAVSTPAEEPADPGNASAAPVDQGALAAISGRGGIIMPIHQGSNWYELNFSLAKPPIKDADLALLEPVASNLWRLDLGGSEVTASGMTTVAGCSNLRVLKLEDTSIDNAGIATLDGLSHLEVLNLYGTSVDDGVLPSLEAMPALKQVYLWDTKVTLEGVESLREAKPELGLDLGEGLKLPVVEEPAEPATPAEPAEPASPEPQPGADAGGEATAALPDCCQKAVDAGGECDHPCCVEARAKGEICPKCSNGA